MVHDGVDTLAERVAGEAAASPMRKMTVGEALTWAWSEELPKADAAMRGAAADLSSRSAWSAIAAYGELHSIVDRQPNRFGCIPFDEPGWPHPDALAIADAVAGLADCIIDVPEGWHPMPELAGIDEALARRALVDTMVKATRQEGGRLFFRIRPDMLVVRFAILAIAPDWRMIETPERRVEMGANGKPRWFVEQRVSEVIGTMPDGSDRIVYQSVEVDGWSERRKMPMPGAYQKAYLDPDPVPAMVARAEYEIFVAAMRMLFDELSGRLETIRLVATDWPDQPWSKSPESQADAAVVPGRRILPDLIAAEALRTATKTPTKSAAKGSKRAGRKRA